jgi:hypothetical protein
MSLQDSHRHMLVERELEMEQTIAAALNRLEEYRQENEMTHEQLLEMSDVAVRRLIYSKPISPQNRKIFAQILARLAEILGD